MKKLTIGVAAAALLSVPVLAFQAGAGHGGMMGMMKEPMTRAQVQAKIKERFTAADANKDSFLVQTELDSAKARMKTEMQAHRKARMDQRFTTMDSNKDGSVSKAEFDAFHEQKMADRMDGGPDKDKPMGPGMKEDGKMGHHGRHDGMGGYGHMMSLESLDTNKDGKVSLDEASAKPLAMFDAADGNKDGTVTPDERRAARAAMWEKMRAEPGAAAPAERNQ